MSDTTPQVAPALGAEITAEHPVVVLGGGPAGLTAAYQLVKQGKAVVVLESTDALGGIARTTIKEGFRFDLGGHRFFTKVKEVDDLWHEIMGDDFLQRPRQSRIYWNDKFLEYPLQGMDVIKQLGPIELMRCGISYLWAAVKPKGNEDTFEDWVSNRFGKRLYNHFFKTYTEKLWGVKATEIRAEWAAQRIKGLSFFAAAKAAFFGNEGNEIKSLISKFNYPKYGPGQMWEKMADAIKAGGGEIRLNAPVTKLVIEGGKVAQVIAGGETLTPSHVISSLPLRTTVGIAEPEAPVDVRDAARGLRYREFLTVLLVIGGHDLFPDNWIYIHQPGVRVLRIQNFKSWSPYMVPEGSKDASVGMEYFCFEGDELWNTDDQQLVKMASQEIEKLKLAKAADVKFGFVERVHKAYPIYDELYAQRVQTIRDWLAGDLQHHAGRAQRSAPVQQLRPLDADRDAGRRQHPARDPPRHLVGQRRERVPRRGPRLREPVPPVAADAGDGATARAGALALVRRGEGFLGCRPVWTAIAVADSPSRPRCDARLRPRRGSRPGRRDRDRDRERRHRLDLDDRVDHAGGNLGRLCRHRSAGWNQPVLPRGPAVLLVRADDDHSDPDGRQHDLDLERRRLHWHRRDHRRGDRRAGAVRDRVLRVVRRAPPGAGPGRRRRLR